MPDDFNPTEWITTKEAGQTSDNYASRKLAGVLHWEGRTEAGKSSQAAQGRKNLRLL